MQQPVRVYRKDRLREETSTNYFVIVPQAMRSPALPEGSVFMSSALAWMTRAVPPFEYSEFGPSLRFTRGSTIDAFDVPLAFTVKFGISPACGPSGLFRP